MRFKGNYLANVLKIAFKQPKTACFLAKKQRKADSYKNNVVWRIQNGTAARQERGQTMTKKKRIEEIKRRIADLEEIKQIEENEEPIKWRLLFVIYVELEELQEELERLLNAVNSGGTVEERNQTASITQA